MGRPGRKPIPTEVKRLRGNPGHRPLNDAEPKFRPASSRMPRGSMPEIGKAFWRKYFRKLAAAEVVTEADVAAFEMMAIHHGLAVRASKQIEDEGLVLIDKNMEQRKHPLLQVFRDNSTAFKGYATEFGMTPSSRSRIKLEKGDQLSLADILFSNVDEDGAPVDSE